MRKELEHLSTRVEWIETDNIYQAIYSLKEILQELIKQVDQALPIDRSDDV